MNLEPPVIQAILFDLDGTLLINPMETFLPAYFEALTEKLAHLMPPDEFLTCLLRSTQRAIADMEGMLTNQEAFLAEFLPAVGYGAEELLPVFEDFYTNDFPKLKCCAQRRPEAREVVQNAFARGCDVAIATNPLFPRAAIMERLRWAGVGDFPYALVTSYENMHFTKPHPEYYWEIAERIGHDPGECLMVGDSLENDVQPAAEAGMDTFWIADEPADGHAASWAGTLLDVMDLLDIITP